MQYNCVYYFDTCYIRHTTDLQEAALDAHVEDAEEAERCVCVYGIDMYRRC
jgi:hypothetical protein